MTQGCECLEEGRYPCKACQRDIRELVTLLNSVVRELDSVVRDTLRTVQTVLERMR